MPIEKEFVLSYVFGNFSEMENGQRVSSPTENYFGVPWKTVIQRNTDHLSFYLHCEHQKTDEAWSIDTWREISIAAANGKKYIRHGERAFHDAETSWGWANFIEWDKAMKDYVSMDTLTVEVRVKIKKMTGIRRKNLMSFDESTKQFSDVVLVVENQKFYVLKLYLASQSTYFEALFLRNFEESEKAEICLSEVDAQDFQNFLELLHGESPIDESTIEGIVHLADFYDAKLAIRKCEQFLIENQKVTLKQKLQLASLYNLESLKNDCLSKITTVADIRSVLTDDASQMDSSVLGALLHKSLALNEK